MMMLDNPMTCRNLFVAAIIAVVPMPASIAHAQVAVVDDGKPITELEIEQRSKLNQISTHKTPSRDDVIEELRKEKLQVQEARKLGWDVPDSEVDQAYAFMASRMRLTPEQLTQQLARQGVNVDTLKQRIRADLASRQPWTQAPRP